MSIIVATTYIALNYLERFRYVNPAVLLLLKLENFIHLYYVHKYLQILYTYDEWNLTQLSVYELPGL